MLTLEDQFTKALTEMDTNSKITLHMVDGKEMVITHNDLLSIGAETIKIIRKINERTQRGKVRIVPYTKINYITYTINTEVYEVYREKSLPASEVDEENIPLDDNTPTQGTIRITVKDAEETAIENVTAQLTQENTTIGIKSTNENGEVAFENVTYGTYTLSLTLEDYTPITEEVTLNTTEQTLNYTLQLAEHESEGEGAGLGEE